MEASGPRPLMCVYIHIDMYTIIYVNVCLYTHVLICRYVYVYTHTYVCVCIHASVHLYLYPHFCVFWVVVLAISLALKNPRSFLTLARHDCKERVTLPSLYLGPHMIQGFELRGSKLLRRIPRMRGAKSKELSKGALLHVLP